MLQKYDFSFKLIGVVSAINELISFLDWWRVLSIIRKLLWFNFYGWLVKRSANIFCAYNRKWEEKSSKETFSPSAIDPTWLVVYKHNTHKTWEFVITGCSQKLYSWYNNNYPIQWTLLTPNKNLMEKREYILDHLRFL